MNTECKSTPSVDTKCARESLSLTNEGKELHLFRASATDVEAAIKGRHLIEHYFPQTTLTNVQSNDAGTASSLPESPRNHRVAWKMPSMVNGQVVAIDAVEADCYGSIGMERQHRALEVVLDEVPNIVRRTSLHGKALTVLMSRKESFYRKYQVTVYNFLERPKSHAAIAYHVFVFTSVLICLVTSVLSTVQEVMLPAAQALIYMELSMLVWFFIEYIVRMWSAGCRSRYQSWRGRLRFARRPFCIVDVVLIISSVIVLAGDNDNNVFAASALRGLRFFQILRMIRVDRRAGSFKLLASVVWAHRQELFTTMYIGFLGLISSSFLIYMVEKKYNKNINSYADALWWGVITISTVGYGDVVPVTCSGKLITGTCCLCIISFFALTPITLCTVGYGDTVPRTWIGKVIAAFCAVAGISFFALPAGILGSGFALKVQQHQRQKHLIRRRIPAATLIQCLWRCYAADKRSTSQATWAIYRKSHSSSASLFSVTVPVLEKQGLVKFGQRLSSIRRRAEKLKIHSGNTSTNVFRNPSSSETVDARVIAGTKRDSVSMTMPVEADVTKSTSVASPFIESIPSTNMRSERKWHHLRHAKSEYKLTEARKKIISMSLKERSPRQEHSNVMFSVDSNEDLDLTCVGSEILPLRLKSEVDENNFGSPAKLPRSRVTVGSLGYLKNATGPPCCMLTDKDKSLIRAIRKIQYFVAKRKFREALRPYDVKDVIEQYSAGHLDMLSRVKTLQSRLDQILGRQSCKDTSVDRTQVSLATRIVQIEATVLNMEKKMDRVLQLLMKSSENTHIITKMSEQPRQEQVSRKMFLFPRSLNFARPRTESATTDGHCQDNFSYKTVGLDDFSNTHGDSFSPASSESCETFLGKQTMSQHQSLLPTLKDIWGNSCVDFSHQVEQGTQELMPESSIYTRLSCQSPTKFSTDKSSPGTCCNPPARSTSMPKQGRSQKSALKTVSRFTFDFKVSDNSVGRSLSRSTTNPEIKHENESESPEHEDVFIDHDEDRRTD